MQRRAAAIYFAFFLVVGAAAYGYIGVAQSTQQPQFSLDGTTFEGNVSNTIDGTQYNVTELGHASGGGGGHGGGGGEMVATLSWVNRSARLTATLDNGSSTTYQGTTYTVVAPNQSNASSFTLREAQNVSAILANDSAVRNSLATQNGTDYVVYTANDSLVPASQYLPTPQTRQFSTGDTYRYEGNRTTVSSIGSEGVTLTWTGPASRSTELTEGANVTLAGGQGYFVHFPSSEVVSLVPSDQYPDYSQTLAEQSYFTERINGLWGIVIISGVAAFLILSMAYMPNRG